MNRRRIVVMLAGVIAVAASLALAAPTRAAEAADVAAPVERLDAAASSQVFDGGAETAQPSTAGSCDDLVADDRMLDREIDDLEPAGVRGHPRLCLLYYPTEDVYWAVILRVDGAGHFRAAKADAADRLLAGGFDLCAIGKWGSYGRFSADDLLRFDDVLDQPVECAPRVVAGDPGAGRRLDDVRASVSRHVEITAEQMNWRPVRSLTLIVFTDANAAAAGMAPHVRSADEAAQLARAGRSISIRESVYGGLILLNLSQFGSREMSDAYVAHEYTHFAQGGILGNNGFAPKWIIEGQAVYQETHNAGSPVGKDLTETATKNQRNGAALRLADISRYQDWDTHEQSEGSSAVYSRGYAAVEFLVKRYGFDATVQLLRDDRNGSIEQFNRLLADLTGMDLEAFDQAVGSWLLTGETAPAGSAATSRPAAPASTPATQLRPSGTPPGGAHALPANGRYVAVDNRGYLRIEIKVNQDATVAEGRAEFVREAPCAAGRVVRAGVSFTFTLDIRPDLVFSGTGTAGSAVVTLDGRFTKDHELVGALRYNNAAATGCDTGLLAFTAMPAM